jgi:hypothetical protein
VCGDRSVEWRLSVGPPSRAGAHEEADMNVLNRFIVVAAVLLVWGAAQTANAQIVGELEFTTTFPFTVGNATLPAGTYTLRPDDLDPRMLEISGAHVGLFFLTDFTDSAATSKRTEVVFNRYGDQYVLKNVFLADSEVGYETEPMPRAQRAAMKGPASEHHVPMRKKPAASSRTSGAANDRSTAAPIGAAARP